MERKRKEKEAKMMNKTGGRGNQQNKSQTKGFGASGKN